MSTEIRHPSSQREQARDPGDGELFTLMTAFQQGEFPNLEKSRPKDLHL